MAVSAAMYSTLRTEVLPPAMVLRPRIRPESRWIGATPTRAAKVAADGAQLGQLSKEGSCGHIADAGNRLQERLGLAPNRRGLDRLADVAVDLGELSLQEDDMAVEPPGEVFVDGLAATVGLHADQ